MSYLSKEIVQNELTPKQIFNSVYRSKIEEDFKAGKIKIVDDKVVLEDGTELSLETGKEIQASS